MQRIFSTATFISHILCVALTLLLYQIRTNKTMSISSSEKEFKFSILKNANTNTTRLVKRLAQFDVLWKLFCCWKVDRRRYSFYLKEYKIKMKNKKIKSMNFMSKILKSIERNYLQKLKI